MSDLDKENGADHARMIMNSNIYDWVFADECSLQLFWSKKEIK